MAREAASVNRRTVVDHHAIPVGFAGVDEALVLRAVGLVVVVVFETLEMECKRVAEGVICDRAVCRGGRFADESVSEVVDLQQMHQFGLKRLFLFGGEVGFEPEIDGVDHVWREGGSER